MLGFSYLSFLLFIIILTLYLERKNINLSPKKIKLFLSISLIVLIIRYIVLLLYALVDKQSIIYMLKYYTFLNYFSIPLIVLSCLYIFLRDEKIRFNTMYMFMILIGFMYGLMVWLYSIKINISSIFGFMILLEDGMNSILVYLIIIASLFMFTFINSDRPYCNKKGMRILMITMVIYIIEYILFIGGIKLYPYPMISELFILLCAKKAIFTFK